MSNEMGLVGTIEQRNRTESGAETTATIEKSPGANGSYQRFGHFSQIKDVTKTPGADDLFGEVEVWIESLFFHINDIAVRQ